MVYDENNEEFRPRFGYKRANNGIEEMPIVEVKAGQDPFADPWADARSDKKLRVKKNMKNMLRNQGRGGGKTVGSSKSYGKYLVVYFIFKVKCMVSIILYYQLYYWYTNIYLNSFIDPESIPGIPMDVGRDKTVKRGKGGLKRALQLVQHSTASMGR